MRVLLVLRTVNMLPSLISARSGGESGSGVGETNDDRAELERRRASQRAGTYGLHRWVRPV